MKSLILLVFVVSVLLCSCNQNKSSNDNIPVVGGLDSSVIAGDTVMEQTLESSYEYAKTLNISPKLAYDVRAYGGNASYGEYAIIRRGADNKPDTVVRAKRYGAIINTFAADLNHNGDEEIYLVMKKTFPHPSTYVMAFEMDKKGIAAPLVFGDSSRVKTINTQTAYDSIHPSADSIYVKDGLLMKTYPRAKNDSLNSAYKLNGNKFVIIPNH